MSTKRYKPEQIVNLLRQIEVEVANGKTTPQACRDGGITAQTYYRWRKEFGGLKLDAAHCSAVVISSGITSIGRIQEGIMSKPRITITLETRFMVTSKSSDVLKSSPPVKIPRDWVGTFLGFDRGNIGLNSHGRASCFVGNSS